MQSFAEYTQYPNLRGRHEDQISVDETFTSKYVPVQIHAVLTET